MEEKEKKGTRVAVQRAEQKPECPVYRRCGGCQLQNMSYEQQLKWKQEKTRRMLQKFCRVSPIIGMENPRHYRNKVQAAFGLDRGGRIISGVYQSGTHRIVPVDSCLTEDLKADEIIVTIRGLLREFKLPPYDEGKGRGFLRHVLVKRGFTSGQIMVVLVAATPIFPNKKLFVDALLKKHPEITTVIHNVNERFTSMVLGEAEHLLYGPGYIEDTLCGCVFRISAKSFYQINPVQTEKLYQKAISFCGLTGKETVIDAYCGIGTIGLCCAGSAARVIGVEVNRDAVKDAVVNAKLNGIKNASFYVGDAGEFLQSFAQGNQRADVVILDPPRAGSTVAFLSAVMRLGPKRVVYISCNPETQERDLAWLTRHGYEAREIQPVDMFPHTNHIETICLLTRKGEA